MATRLCCTVFRGNGDHHGNPLGSAIFSERISVAGSGKKPNCMPRRSIVNLPPVVAPWREQVIASTLSEPRTDDERGQHIETTRAKLVKRTNLG